MADVMIQISMVKNGRPADAAEIAQWVGEALSSEDVRDSRDTIIVHSVNVEVDG